MSTLSKLSFVELPVNATRDVVGYKRKRLVDRIEEQRALLRDPSFTKTVKRWNGKKGAADRKKVDKAVRMTPCWRSLPAGGFAVTLRIGGKLIEFAPGKNAVAVKAIEQVDGVLQQFQAAIRSGEFDQFLAVKRSQKSQPSKRKAA
jgi:Family of unknown function (DUF6641)